MTPFWRVFCGIGNGAEGLALGNLTFEAEMSLQGTVVGPRGAPRTCTLGRGTHPTHSIDLGGGGGPRATLPHELSPISTALGLRLSGGGTG